MLLDSHATVLDYNAPGVSSQTPAAGTFGTGLRWAFDAFNSTGGLNQDCVAAKRSSEVGTTADCMFAEHVAPYIRAPLFALQSQYDAWQTGSILAPGKGKTATFWKPFSDENELPRKVLDKTSGKLMERFSQGTPPLQ